MQGHRIGYVRVSSFDQNPERQLEQTQVSKVFTDKASGKDTQRPPARSAAELRPRRRYSGGAQHGSAGPQPR